jgi:hypothetical protein
LVKVPRPDAQLEHASAPRLERRAERRVDGAEVRAIRDRRLEAHASGVERDLGSGRDRRAVDAVVQREAQPERAGQQHARRNGGARLPDAHASEVLASSGRPSSGTVRGSRSRKARISPRTSASADG